MSEPTSAQPPAPVAPAAEATKDPETTAPKDDKAGASEAEAKTNDAEAAKPSVEKKAAAGEDAASTEPSAAAEAKPGETGDAEMKDADAAAVSAAADGDETKDDADVTAASPKPADAAAPATPADKSSKSRRKSTSASAAKGKKLNKKASRVRLTNMDAQPGDFYFVKLKGYPRWPAVVCDEGMLPQSLIKTRPVTALRADGTYREDFADGGKRAADRTFPMMYLSTNEFGWVPNTDLEKIDPETVASLKSDKMSKHLQAAHVLASEGHDLDYFKEMLLQHQEDQIKEEEAAKAAEASKEAKALASAKKASKSSAGKKASKGGDPDEDIDMPDAPEDDEDDASVVKEKKPSKKRKAEEEVALQTPSRSDSVKKPKIKLTTNSTPKAPANGAATPKTAASAKATPAAAASETKAAKAKSKKPTKDKDGAEEKKVDKAQKTDKEPAAAPKEPELTAEEKHVRKEKEVLFLRHKLQKGLLTRDQEPKAEEMKTMSDYIAKLEAMPELEVSIIRATKINKVLKGILKLENIPKEDEIQFKPRSQALLDKWNKLLSGPADGAAAPANGVNGDSAAKKAGAGKEKSADKEAPNGVAKENGDAAAKSKKKGGGSPKEGEKEKSSVDKDAKAAETPEVAAA